jgi:hypothetical protein
MFFENLLFFVQIMSGKQVQNTGTNQQGNDYTAYNDGGYAYKNANPGLLQFFFSSMKPVGETEGEDPVRLTYS